MKLARLKIQDGSTLAQKIKTATSCEAAAQGRQPNDQDSLTGAIHVFGTLRTANARRGLPFRAGHGA